MSCTAFKITRWLIFIPCCITSAFYVPVDLYYTFGLSLASVMLTFAFKDLY